MSLVSSRPSYFCLRRLSLKAGPTTAATNNCISPVLHFSSSIRRADNAAVPKIQPAYTTTYKPTKHTYTELLSSSSQRKRHKDTLMQLTLDEMMKGRGPKAAHKANADSPVAAHCEKTKGRKPKRAANSQNIDNGRSTLIPKQEDPNPPPKLSAKERREVAPRRVPSAESGSVPEPTPLYLARTLGRPTTLHAPRRILVVMDLNGTLLFRPSKKRPFDFVERPHARQFMSYCLSTFAVAIWSSARPANVTKMVDRLLSPKQRSKCIVTWARDKFGLSEEDYDLRVQCYKRLARIWQDEDIIASHPDAASGPQRWDQTNTVLVDDSAEKGRSEPHNILQIPEFSGVQNEPGNVLPQVHDYLNQLSYQADISRYMRQNPFKLNPDYTLAAPQTPSTSIP